MDKSLDEIIKERNAEKKAKFQAGRAKPENVNRKARAAEPYNAINKPHFVEKKQPLQQPSQPAAGQPGILSRLGSKAPASVGAPVSISNLNQDVTLTDLTELCGSVGEVLSASFLPSGGKGKKQATVAFARRSDAVSFVSKFNNLTLDGTPMIIKLADGADASAAFSAPAPAPKNNKAGMFGSALRHSAADDDEHMPRFTVTMKNEPAIVKPGVQARSGGFKSGGRGAGPSGGRGGGGRGFKERKPVSEDDLDNALDSYLSERTK